MQLTPARFIILVLLFILGISGGYLMGQNSIITDLYKCEDTLHLLKAMMGGSKV